MGGQLTLDSQPGVGTAFALTIPLTECDMKICDESKKTSDFTNNLMFTNNKCRILLVEDDPVLQKVTEIQLNKHGISVEIADNGRTAIQKIIQQQFDLVFMDCIMPVMDGIEAVSHIRQIIDKKADRYRTLPIIALTANAMAKDREICLENGFSDYLAKPVAESDLISMLNKWLNN